jgi:hypothetical protein
MRARAAALAVLLAPVAALACPVCGQGREGSGTALLVMSIILTLLPLGMIGGVAGFVYLRVKRAERESGLLSAQPKFEK